MRKFKLYSKRNKVPSGELTHFISDQFKARLVSYLDDLCSEAEGSADSLLIFLENLFLKEYGFLNSPGFESAKVSKYKVIQHLFSSDLEQSLDFIEAIFTSPAYSAGQPGVDTINDLFNEHGIGFRLSEFVKREVVKDKSRKKTIEIEYPTIIPITESTTYSLAVRPALVLLAEIDFQVANSEMLDAFTAARTQHFDEAITNACSSFESFLKTICSKLNLTYDPQKDSCTKLIDILVDNSAFPEFYKNQFVSVGTIRNKIGSAHGRGPITITSPNLCHAEHLINITCSNILIIYQMTKDKFKK